MVPGVDGFMYPNEVELQWSLLIVLYPYITGLVAGAFILASLERVFKVEAVRPTYRLALLTALAFLLVAPLPLAIAPGPSGTLFGNVPHAPPILGHGHVRFCILVVPDGRAAVWKSGWNIAPTSCIWPGPPPVSGGSSTGC